MEQPAQDSEGGRRPNAAINAVSVMVAFFVYPPVAWIVLELTDQLAGHDVLPDWVYQVAFFLLIVGFVAALALGWWIGQRFRSR